MIADTKEWSELVTTGVAAPAKENHAIAIIDDAMYVFGGSEYGELTNDLFKLDLGMLLALLSCSINIERILSVTVVIDSKSFHCLTF